MRSILILAALVLAATPAAAEYRWTGDGFVEVSGDVPAPVLPDVSPVAADCPGGVCPVNRRVSSTSAPAVSTASASSCGTGERRRLFGGWYPGKAVKAVFGGRCGR